MADRRDDPMRLWIGKWTPERPSGPPPTERGGDERAAADDDRGAVKE